MKAHYCAAYLALGAIFSGCASSPPSEAQTWAASPDYTASGTLIGVKAYNYGKVTVLELPENRFVTVRDSDGRAVKTERVGEFVRVPSMSKFTVTAGNREATFTAPIKTQVFAAPESNIQEHAKITAQPGDDDVKALLALAESQLHEARQVLENSPQNTLNATLRLNAAEDSLIRAASATIRIGFAYGSSDFKPTAEASKVLIASGIAATSIHVRGFTDSNAPGKLDAKIALARAVSARNFLIDGGVSAEKIKVDFKAAGEHVVPNIGKGRDTNRRVEFEFKNKRISDLASLPIKIDRAGSI